MEQYTKTLQQWLGTGSINLFGLPFAGKDTQGKILADMFDGAMISGGDIMRHAQSNVQVQEIMASGGIVPSELFESIVLPFFSRPELAGHPLILSEVGRMNGEQQVIMRATAQAGHPLKAVVLLDLTDAQVWQRFDASQLDHDRGERADDNRAVLQTRLDNFRAKVTPVIDYYRQAGLLVTINGNQSKEEVTRSMLEALLALAEK